MTLREKILNAKDIKTELVTVSEWDVTVEVRGLTGAQRAAALEKATVTSTNDAGDETQRRDDVKLSALLIIASTYDPETGQRVFGDNDIDPVLEKAAGPLDSVARVAMRLNAGTVESHKALEKNLGATDTGAGASA